MLLEEYAVDLKLITEEKNKAADILIHNDFNHTPTDEVNKTSSEVSIHEMYALDMLVPVGYLTIFTYQQDDAELRENRTRPRTSQNYKLKEFGSYSLWNQTWTTNTLCGFHKSLERS